MPVIRCFVFQGDKKKNKKEKVKPILLNKNEESLVVESLPVPANHFEVIQPKDDLLLKQKGSVSVYTHLSVEIYCYYSLNISPFCKNFSSSLTYHQYY